MTLGRISFGPLTHATLGYDRFFDEVEKLLNSDVQKVSTSFPPHNILKLDDTHYVVELAVAGFSKDEIEITTHDGTLTIKGSKEDKVDGGQYLHRGIGTRSFTKTLTVADTIEVKGAEFKDGILRIGLENIIPESKKPRKIEIGSDLKEFKPQLLQEEKKVA
jgi:molecular chaperone IbpA